MLAHFLGIPALANPYRILKKNNVHFHRTIRTTQLFITVEASWASKWACMQNTKDFEWRWGWSIILSKISHKAKITKLKCFLLYFSALETKQIQKYSFISWDSSKHDSVFSLLYLGYHCKFKHTRDSVFYFSLSLVGTCLIFLK